MRNKRSSPVIAAACAAFMAGTVVVSPANAAGSRSGYIECNPNRQVSVTSYSVNNVSGFYVGHGMAFAGSKKWYTGGYHTSRHDTPGGRWEAWTNGDLRSAGAGCS